MELATLVKGWRTLGNLHLHSCLCTCMCFFSVVLGVLSLMAGLLGKFLCGVVACGEGGLVSVPPIHPT